MASSGALSRRMMAVGGGINFSTGVAALVVAILLGFDRHCGWPVSLTVLTCLWVNLRTCLGLFVFPTLSGDAILYAVLLFMLCTVGVQLLLAQNEGVVAAWQHRVLSNRPELRGVLTHVIVPMLTNTTASWAITLLSPMIFEAMLVPAPPVDPAVAKPWLVAKFSSTLNVMTFVLFALAVLGVKVRVLQLPRNVEMVLLLGNLLATGGYYVYSAMYARGGVDFPTMLFALPFVALPVLCIGVVSVYMVYFANFLIARANGLTNPTLAWIAQVCAHYVLACCVTLWCAEAGKGVSREVYSYIAGSSDPLLATMLRQDASTWFTFLLIMSLLAATCWLVGSIITMVVWCFQKFPMLNVRPRVMNVSLQSIGGQRGRVAAANSEFLQQVGQLTSMLQKALRSPAESLQELTDRFNSMHPNELLRHVLTLAKGGSTMSSLLDERAFANPAADFTVEFQVVIPIAQAHPEPIVVDPLTIAVTALLEPQQVKYNGMFGALQKFWDTIDHRAAEVDVVLLQTQKLTLEPNSQTATVSCSLRVRGFLYIPIVRAVNNMWRDVSNNLSAGGSMRVLSYAQQVIATLGSPDGILAMHIRSLLRGYRLHVLLARHAAMPVAWSAADTDSSLQKALKAVLRSSLQELGPMDMPVLRVEDGSFRVEPGSLFSSSSSNDAPNAASMATLIDGLESASLENFQLLVQTWRNRALVGAVADIANATKLLQDLQAFRNHLGALRVAIRRSENFLAAGEAGVQQPEPVDIDPQAAVPATPARAKEEPDEVVALSRQSPRDLLLSALILLLDIQSDGEKLFVNAQTQQQQVQQSAGATAAPGAAQTVQSAPPGQVVTSGIRVASAAASAMQDVQRTGAQAMLQQAGQAALATATASPADIAAAELAKMQLEFRRTWRDCGLALLGVVFRASVRTAVERASRSRLLGVVEELRQGAHAFWNNADAVRRTLGSVTEASPQTVRGMLRDMSGLEVLLLVGLATQVAVQLYTMWGEDLQPEPAPGGLQIPDNRSNAPADDGVRGGDVAAAAAVHTSSPRPPGSTQAAAPAPSADGVSGGAPAATAAVQSPPPPPPVSTLPAALPPVAEGVSAGIPVATAAVHTPPPPLPASTLPAAPAPAKEYNPFDEFGSPVASSTESSADAAIANTQQAPSLYPPIPSITGQVPIVEPPPVHTSVPASAPRGGDSPLMPVIAEQVAAPPAPAVPDEASLSRAIRPTLADAALGPAVERAGATPVTATSSDDAWLGVEWPVTPAKGEGDRGALVREGLRKRAKQQLTRERVDIMANVDNLLHLAPSATALSDTSAVQVVAVTAIEDSCIIDARARPVAVPACAFDFESTRAGGASYIQSLINNAAPLRDAITDKSGLPQLNTRLLDLDHDATDSATGIPCSWGRAARYPGTPYARDDCAKLVTAQELLACVSSLEALRNRIQEQTDYVEREFAHVVRPMLRSSAARSDTSYVCRVDALRDDKNNVVAPSEYFKELDERWFVKADTADVALLRRLIPSIPAAGLIHVDVIVTTALRHCVAGSSTAPRLVLPLHHVCAFLHRLRSRWWRALADVATSATYCAAFQIFHTVQTLQQPVTREDKSAWYRKFLEVTQYGSSALRLASTAMETKRPRTGVPRLDAANALDKPGESTIVTCAVSHQVQLRSTLGPPTGLKIIPDYPRFAERDSRQESPPFCALTLALHWRTEEEAASWRLRVEEGQALYNRVGQQLLALEQELRREGVPLTVERPAPITGAALAGAIGRLKPREARERGSTTDSEVAAAAAQPLE